MRTQDRDGREAVLHALLADPRPGPRKLAGLHRRWLAGDPGFYQRMAAWSLHADEASGHRAAFVAHLLAGEVAEHRRAGAALLHELQPGDVARVVDFLKVHLGKLPRSTRTAVARYLRRLERDPLAFDRALRRCRRALKRLYAGLHVKPSPRSAAALFKAAASGAPARPTADPRAAPGRGDRTGPLRPARITRPTALLVDRSGSMEIAIEVGQRLATLLAGLADAELLVYAFHAEALRLLPEGRGPAGWERAFGTLEPSGTTSIGSALAALHAEGHRVEQILIVSDEGENQGPYFADEYARYRNRQGLAPEVLIVHVGRPGDWVERDLRRRRAPVESLLWGPEPGLLERVIPWATRPSRRVLLEEILATPPPPVSAGAVGAR